MADRYRDKPFPAEDEYGRPTHNAPQPQGDSDPLAELARLIGQADPLSNFGHEQRPPAERRDHYEAREPDASYNDEPAARPSWVQNLAAARQANEQPYGEEEQYDPRYADERHDAGRGFDHAPRFDQQRFDQPGFDQQPRFDSRLPQQAAGQHVPVSDRYDDVLYGRPDHDPGHNGHYGTETDYRDDGYDRPPYDEGADDQYPKSRRGGTMTVVVVLLLAVVGTGAAFAYRTFIGSPRSGEPPIIKADAGPNKVVPAGASDASGKQIYDRVGDKATERMVSREEQPVDVNSKTAPRVVFPPLTQNANPPSAASASIAARPTGSGVGNGTLSGEEPRKIRTLSIRPDQPDSMATPASAPAARPAQAAVQRASAPSSTASTGAPASNGPVSLSPQAQPAAAPEARQRTASLAPSASAGGSYVQVSSQRSEADAQSSFRTLQGKYPSILGSRTPLVRRADLGDKGVFYRAVVGPFGTTDEATQFCVNLKSAGGQCMVQRN